LLNIKEGASYLQDPNDEAYQQQQQQQAEEQKALDEAAKARAEEVEKFNAGMTARQVAVLEGQLELDVVKEQNRLMIDLEKQEFSEEEKEARLMLETEKQMHDFEMAEAELVLEERQGRNVSIGQ
jgi:aspartate-semialdehyde dehydrogenase